MELGKFTRASLDTAYLSETYYFALVARNLAWLACVKRSSGRLGESTAVMLAVTALDS